MKVRENFTKVNPLLPNSEGDECFFGGAAPFFSKERGCIVGGSEPLRPKLFLSRKKNVDEKEREHV